MVGSILRATVSSSHLCSDLSDQRLDPDNYHDKYHRIKHLSIKLTGYRFYQNSVDTEMDAC